MSEPRGSGHCSSHGPRAAGSAAWPSRADCCASRRPTRSRPAHPDPSPNPNPNPNPNPSLSPNPNPDPNPKQVAPRLSIERGATSRAGDRVEIAGDRLEIEAESSVLPVAVDLLLPPAVQRSFWSRALLHAHPVVRCSALHWHLPLLLTLTLTPSLTPNPYPNNDSNPNRRTGSYSSF